MREVLAAVARDLHVDNDIEGEGEGEGGLQPAPARRLGAASEARAALRDQPASAEQASRADAAACAWAGGGLTTDAPEVDMRLRDHAFGRASMAAMHLLRRAVCGALLLCALVSPTRSARADDLLVFAAASLKTALEEIAALWTAKTGEEITLSFAGSSALARQIERGAPADAFISANRDWMDALEAAGWIAADTRIDLVGNRLVLIAHGSGAPPVALGPETDLAGLLGEGRLAMALVDAVPAGIYGRAALAALGLWEAAAPKVAQADNARAALALVATGAVPFGIVYATDAAAEDRVSVVATFPAATHPSIVYPAGAVAGGAVARARAFLAFLGGAEARSAFARHGFLPPPEG